MSFGSASILHKAAIPVSGLATLLQIIAIATVGWYKYEYGGVTKTQGLWQSCNSIGTLKACVSITHPGDKLAAIRAMEVIGMLICIAAVVLLLLHILVEQQKKYTGIGFFVAAFVSAFFIMIGVIIYGSSVTGGNGALFYSFGLAIVAAILMIVSGVLGVMGRRGADG